MKKKAMLKKKRAKKTKTKVIKKPTIVMPNLADLPLATQKAAKKAIENAVAAQVSDLAYDQLAAYTKWASKSNEPEAKTLRKKIQEVFKKALLAELDGKVESLVKDIQLNLY
jgi:hypothetical protein